METNLSPAQHTAYKWFTNAWNSSPLLHLWSPDGYGRSKVLRELHQKFGGARVGLMEFVNAAEDRHPLALENAFFSVLMDALRDNEFVFVDDWHVATAAISDCNHMNPRAGFLDSPASVIAAYVQDCGKRLVIASNGHIPGVLRSRCIPYSIPAFQASDYKFISSKHAKEGIVEQIDFEKVHRFAPRLNGHQLKMAAKWVLTEEQPDTERYIEYLTSQQLTSNVELGEVSEVSLTELKGLDDVIESLEANIIMPFENGELARSLDIKPKRGVLLAGPPGTGKTTVGRALAHRLKGKFFLIDGTVISGTQDFYGVVHRIFEFAKDNAPAIIFIDDSDVIFESGQEHGLYRYLLTMLDGLESKSIGRVCVILTAMDVGNLPPALVRSGRIELWLDMHYPDLDARVEILRQQVEKLPDPLNGLDVNQIAALTEGQSGADLKRIVEEGKTLYAFDLSRKTEVKDITSYFAAAVEQVRQSREKYAEAEARANANRDSRPTWFNPDLHATTFSDYAEDDS